MKNISIEEKAKAYDEAIKRLEDIKTGKCQKTFMFTEGLFDYIFPELKSEDERIKNFISNELACLIATDGKGTIRYNELTEVDLEKEIKEEYLKRRCYVGKNNMLAILNEPQFNEVAKHFYELGIKAQKGE